MTLNFRLMLLPVLTLLATVTYAQTIRVAAAANLQGITKVLAADFKKKTGVTAEIIVGSSGKLVAQISNGAPYDLFLSADMDFPEQLFDKGFALHAPVVYTKGCLVVCSRDKQNFNEWQKLLLSDKVDRVAIGNPAIAPYGRAAQEALQHYQLLDAVKPKLVYGESIAQVDTYIITSAAKIGFTSRSLALDPNATTRVYWKAVDPAAYKPLEQGMVMLKHAKTAGNEVAAKQFYDYILSEQAAATFKRYGYLKP